MLVWFAGLCSRSLCKWGCSVVSLGKGGSNMRKMDAGRQESPRNFCSCSWVLGVYGTVGRFVVLALLNEVEKSGAWAAASLAMVPLKPRNKCGKRQPQGSVID